MTRICLDTLRRASALLCDRDIALVLMTARGMDTDKDRLVKLVSKRVGCCLRGQREWGASRPRKGLGKPWCGG